MVGADMSINKTFLFSPQAAKALYKKLVKRRLLISAAIMFGPFIAMIIADLFFRFVLHPSFFYSSDYNIVPMIGGICSVAGFFYLLYQPLWYSQSQRQYQSARVEVENDAVTYFLNVTNLGQFFTSVSQFAYQFCTVTSVTETKQYFVFTGSFKKININRQTSVEVSTLKIPKVLEWDFIEFLKTKYNFNKADEMKDYAEIQKCKKAHISKHPFAGRLVFVLCLCIGSIVFASCQNHLNHVDKCTIETIKINSSISSMETDKVESDTITKKIVKYDGKRYAFYDSNEYNSFKDGDTVTFELHTVNDSHVLAVNGKDTEYGEKYFSTHSQVTSQ
jgi:hypothetical protein